MYKFFVAAASLAALALPYAFGQAPTAFAPDDPAQGPCNIPRQSPKYRHVRESDPSGTGGAS